MATAILLSVLEDLQCGTKLGIRCEMERLLEKNDLEMVMRGQNAMNWIRDVLIINEEINVSLDYELIVPSERCDDDDNILKCCSHKFITISLSPVKDYRSRKKTKNIRKEVDRLYETRPSPSTVELVGFDGYIQRLDGWLREEGDPHSCKRIGVIYGPPGSGKTNLAFEVYNNDVVKTHFSSLVWVPTPPSSSLDDTSYYKLLLRRFMETVLPSSGGNMTTEAICNALKDKRYLIVVDGNVDLNSETNFFEMLRNMGILNVGQNGSRVVVTSLKKIDPNGPWSDCCDNVIELQPLSKEDSWKLFTKCSGAAAASTVYAHSDIVKNCEGLPSAFVNVGFLLSAVKAETPLPQLDIPKIVSMASKYHCLRLFSKLFFLSCGMFPKGSEIPVKRLFRLLRLFETLLGKECGFIQYEITEFLRDLQVLGLIEVEGSGTCTMKAKTCRLKATAYDFCIMKATQINFFNIIGNRLQRHNFPKVVVHRLALHPDYYLEQITAINPILSHLRWLLCFSETNRRGWKKLFKRLKSSKSLLVLDLESMKSLKSLPKWIGKLKFLRYLGLRGTSLDRLPSSIVKLRFLQTLDIRETHIHPLPTSIKKLESLVHLYMDVDTSVDGDSPNLSALKKIRTLSMIRAGDWMKGWVHITKIQKLGIYGDLDLCGNLFVYSMDFLMELESLKLGFGFEVLSKSRMTFTLYFSRLRSLYLERQIEGLPDPQDFPPSLTKLHLRWTQLDQDPMPTLEQLPNLKVLKLRCSSYLGKEMVCSQTGFKQLLVLELDLLESLEELRVENTAMLKLKCLVIRLCKRLKMIPKGLQHLHELQRVDVSGMPVTFNARLQHSSGEDWNEVQHIRSVIVDGIQMGASSSSSNPASSF